MQRTPLKERELPRYSQGEEKANTVTHIIGGAMGIIITAVAVITAAVHRNIWGIVSAGVYGLTLIDLYTMSSIYHGLRHTGAKKVMQVIDHCTIYFLIAGTYTPVLLSGIRPVNGAAAWTVFGLEWALAAKAATLTAIDLKKYKRLSMVCYIGMGWLILPLIKLTVTAISLGGFLWLLGGGIAYTVGAVLYALGARRPYYHAVFHIFVNLGSLAHAVCIICYVL